MRKITFPSIKLVTNTNIQTKKKGKELEEKWKGKVWLSCRYNGMHLAPNCDNKRRPKKEEKGVFRDKYITNH